MSARGFEYNKRITSFVRDCGGRSEHLLINCQYMYGAYSICFFLAVRCDETEELIERFNPRPVTKTSKRYPVPSRTIILNTTNVSPTYRMSNTIPGSWYIGQPCDFVNIESQVKSFVDGYCMQWFQRHNNEDRIFEELLSLDGHHCGVQKWEKLLALASLSRDSSKLQRALDYYESIPDLYKEQDGGLCNFALSTLAEVESID